jgi:hypothetical protein
VMLKYQILDHMYSVISTVNMENAIMLPMEQNASKL